jgi:catechol 2,3-dioxygenase-like lactoylglutathione lyase family enzyme
MRVIGFDHLVLRTTDVERSLAFYSEVLGLEPVRVAEWRAGEVGFPSVRVNAETILDFFAVDAAQAPLDHFCLVVEALDWAAEIAAGLTVVRGPVRSSGAQGDGTSIYLRDPDGNTIELRHYGEHPS